MKHSSLCQFPRVQKSKLGRGGADVLGAGLRAAPACKSRGSATCRSAFSCRAMGNNNTDDDGGLLAGRGSEPLGPGAGLGGAGVAALVGGVLLIGLVLAGNSLVCVSVASERTLQTPTNYFIVSLAAADLLLALLVLPLFVYSEVSLHVPAPLSSVPSALALLPSPARPWRGSAAWTFSNLEPGCLKGLQASSFLTAHRLPLVRIQRQFCVCPVMLPSSGSLSILCV